MPGSPNWSKGGAAALGVSGELEWIEQWLNGASRDALANCALELRRTTDLMVTLVTSLSTGVLPPGLAVVSNNWFGIGTPSAPMWLWDCTLSLSQMHLVMAETSARVCELLVASIDAGNRAVVELFIECGHPKLRTLLAWDRAQSGDARPPVEGRWNPADARSVPTIRVWIFAPFSDGYEMGATPDRELTAWQVLAGYVAAVQSGTPVQQVMPTVAEVMAVADNLRHFRFPWRQNPEVRVSNDGAAADPAGICYYFHDPVVEPPVSWFEEMPPPLPITPRTTRGIEITWCDAPEGYIRNETSWDGSPLPPQPPAGGSAA